jgi:hypothetical protein
MLAVKLPLPPQLQATVIASSTAGGQLRAVFILPQGVSPTCFALEYSCKHLAFKYTCHWPQQHGLPDMPCAHCRLLQVHDTLKTAADYQAYLAQALPSLPEDVIEVRWSSPCMPPAACCCACTGPGLPCQEPL